MLNKMPKWLRIAFQLAITAGLIALVLHQIDLKTAATLLVQMRETGWAVPMLLAALALFNASKIVSALRTNSYQRHRAIHVNQADNLRLYYVGMFLNLFLPGGIGGDGYKILVLHRYAAAPVKALIRTTLADRVNGLIILLMLSCWLWALPALKLPTWLTDVIKPSWLLSVAAVLLLAAFVGGHRRVIGMDSGQTSHVFAYGLAVQLLQLGCMTMLLLMMRVQPADLAPYLAVFLLSSVAAVLPLTVGGLGVRELSFVYGMQWLALDPIPGVLASSGFFMVTLVSSLVGAIFLRRFSANVIKAAAENKK